MTSQDESAQPLSFERDIRPLFREKDRTSMLRAFDLWSFTDVVAHLPQVFLRVDQIFVSRAHGEPPEMRGAKLKSSRCLRVN